MTLLPKTDPVPQQKPHKHKHQMLPRIQTTAVDAEPLMAAPRSAESTRRPQIYVHFEFGVSYSQKHPGNRHGLTYMSRNWREHTGFPRQPPPTNTNYLEFASVPRQQRQQRQQQQQNSHSSGSSHERGTSAPPPWNNSPWDAEPEPMGASALPQRVHTQRERPSHERRRTSADVWKALPAVPTSYRLSEHIGDDGVPWSTGWPNEFGIPDGEDNESFDDGEFVPFANQPTVIQVTADGRRMTLQEDPSREAGLEDLSNAMMTVDNGFETQWWNQGERLVVGYTEAGEPVMRSPIEPQPEAIPIPEEAQMSTRSVGWAIAQQPYASLPSSSAGFNFVTVSPMTATDISSPQFWTQQSTQHPRVQRSLTTRSDELFFAV
ncbi:hypothetical protein ACHAQA_007940 [Verticillium albo-atrum]